MKEKETAYWDWQVDGTHFCSHCGTDAFWRFNGEKYVETPTQHCPRCGRLMTHIENQEVTEDD